MIDKENDRRGGEGAKEWGEKRHGVKMGRRRGEDLEEGRKKRKKRWAGRKGERRRGGEET